MLKLCVGADSVEDLESWIAERMAARKAAGRPIEQIHTTRMTPKRGEELLDGGSLYWVIKGSIQCRQPFVALRPVTGDDGIARCELVLEPKVVRTAWQPRRAFQGWRYLTPVEAPSDAGSAERALQGLPADLRSELAQLGLL